MNDSQDKPRKILLGKKVIRHFAVRTGIQTGAKDTSDTLTGDDTTSGQLDPSKDTGEKCSENTSTGSGCGGTRLSYGGGGGEVATNARC